MAAPAHARFPERGGWRPDHPRNLRAHVRLAPFVLCLLRGIIRPEQAKGDPLRLPPIWGRAQNDIADEIGIVTTRTVSR